MSNLDNVNVHLVEDLDSAHAFLTWLGERRPVLAIDTETNGLSWWEIPFLRMVQFGDGATGWSVPIRNWRGVAEEALRYVRDDRHETVFHNVTFDLHALESDDLPTPDLHHVHDTATMHRLLEPLAFHSLKGICGAEFGPEAVAGQNLLKKDMTENGWTWATVPDDRPSYWAYAALDTVLTALLAERLSPRLRTAGLDEPYEREMAVQLIMYRAECRGMRIDPDYTRRLKQTWETEAEALRRQLRNAGVERPGSNKAVNEALKAAGWEPDEFTDTGQPRLDKAILNHLLTTPYANVAEPLLRFRRIKKWTSTYLDTFLTKRDADDRVHASINTMGARTGRMSITKPGLQTLPRGSEIRDCVVPYTDDERLASIDYDTMEMRMFADYTGDPGLVGAFRAGEDIHQACAAAVYGVPFEQVTKDQRQTAKNVNFARIYGAGPAKIALTAGVTEGEIREYLRIFDERFSQAVPFIKSVEQAAKERAAHEGQPYITTIGGRRLPAEPDRLYALLNYLVQGGCADIYKGKIIALDAAGLADHIVVPVHDELIFSFPAKGFDEYARTALDTMEEHEQLSVPMTCGLDGPLERWGDKGR